MTSPGTSTPTFVETPSNTPPISAFAASQSSLTFANTLAPNVSAPQTLTLDNTGSAAINVSNIQTTPDFTVGNTCSTILQGASCGLSVTFTPQSSSQTGSGTRVGAIEISSNASTSLEFISLVGESTPANLTLGQSPLNFGTVLVGTNATLVEQITNTGPGSATFTGTGTTAPYTTASGSCPAAGGSLAAGATCTIQVTFSPTQSGPHVGTFPSPLRRQRSRLRFC